jgi:hypothetical protein
MLTASQGRRNRRRPKYNHADNPVVACIHSLAWQYHCVVIERKEITLRHKGRTMKLGTIDDVKSMTLRGLIGIFEEITQDWRYEPLDPI